MADLENSDDKKVACEICMKEILRSEAKVEEASGYVAYFCGLDCFDKWKGGDDTNKKDEYSLNPGDNQFEKVAIRLISAGADLSGIEVK